MVKPVIPAANLRWVAESAGPSPLGEDPLVVAELRAPQAPPPEKVLAACHALSRSAFCPQPATQLLDHGAQESDGLLLLGQFAAAWALGALNEVRGYLHCAGAERVGDAVQVWVGHHHPDLSREALTLILRNLLASTDGQDATTGLDVALKRLWQACRRYHPDYQARILMTGARELHIPVLQFLPGSKHWQYGWGARSRVFMESGSNADGVLGWQWQHSKALSKQLFTSLGLPTPPDVLVRQAADLPAALKQIGFPCAIKPMTGGGGKGVTANIQCAAAAQQAYQQAVGTNPGAVLVEQHLVGQDHRLMVINGKLVATIRREAACITGDGQRSVRELIAELNSTRSTNLTASHYLRPIQVDGVITAHLATHGLQVDDVPAIGAKVTLRSNANLSTGGTCTDVTAETHPMLRAMAEQLAISSGLATAGLDYITTDISLPPGDTGGGFIEFNAVPGLDACLAAGWQHIDIARLLLESLEDIPVVLTVANSTGLEMERRRLQAQTLGESEAWACGDTLAVGAAELKAPAEEPWGAVRAALRNRRVKRLEILCTTAELLQFGAPVAQLAKVSVLDPALPAEWLGLLERLTTTAKNAAPQD